MMTFLFESKKKKEYIITVFHCSVSWNFCFPRKSPNLALRNCGATIWAKYKSCKCSLVKQWMQIRWYGTLEKTCYQAYFWRALISFYFCSKLWIVLTNSPKFMITLVRTISWYIKTIPKLMSFFILSICLVNNVWKL